MEIVLSKRNGTLLTFALLATVVLLSCNNKQKDGQKTEEVKIEVATSEGTKDFTIYS